MHTTKRFHATSQFLRGHRLPDKVWPRAQAEIDCIIDGWALCFKTYGGPFLFGEKPCAADAMYAPVVTRFLP